MAAATEAAGFDRDDDSGAPVAQAHGLEATPLDAVL